MLEFYKKYPLLFVLLFFVDIILVNYSNNYLPKAWQYSSWLALIVPLASLLGFAMLFAKPFKIRLIFALPSVTSLIIILLTIGSATNTLYSLTGMIIFLGLAACAYGVLNYFSDLEATITTYKIEIYILTALTIAYGIYVSYGFLTKWDDLSFWGVFIKELKSYNVIYPNEGTLTSVLPSHAHYPRGASLFYYFTLYFIGYDEVTVMRSNFILHLIFLAPLMANKYWWQTLGFISIMLILPVNWHGVYTLYTDGLVGLVFASILIINILEDNQYKSLFLITPIIASITLFKEVGLWLGLMSVILIAINFSIKNKANLKNNKVILWWLLILFILPILANHLWFTYYEATHTALQVTKNRHSLTGLLKLIVELNNNEFKRSILFSCVHALLKIFTSIPCLLIYLLNIITFILIKKYSPKYKKDFLNFLVVSVICVILYCIWRLYLWLTIQEGASVVVPDSHLYRSFFRYLVSILIIFIAVPCAYIKKIIAENNLSLTKQNNVVLYFIYPLVFVSFSYVTIYLITHFKIKKNFAEHQSLMKNTSALVNLYAKGFNIDYDFSYKGVKSSDEQSLQKKFETCYTRAYFLSPYYNNNIRNYCLYFKQNDSFVLPMIKHHAMDSNIEIDKILQNPKFYQKKCQIKYYQVYDYLEINCLK